MWKVLKLEVRKRELEVPVLPVSIFSSVPPAVAILEHPPNFDLTPGHSGS